MLAYMLSLFNLTMAANNPINTLTAFAETHTHAFAHVVAFVSFITIAANSSVIGIVKK
ncbi:hypothetical protein MADE_000001020740 [Alteromonas mediterranea DE]|uniref:Uncharacterized protein n=1 Tax=Alteromonas mediterranea (strain DSM 17117 / CIP 110805 / LMG 28347 / Deep ecotype) TaxID=1774373 RepID=T2DMN1_ALTMD|nr:hypothetical protein MADE_000001020740 [Alteromonas mediterranea DE]